MIKITEIPWAAMLRMDWSRDSASFSVSTAVGSSRISRLQLLLAQLPGNLGKLLVAHRHVANGHVGAILTPILSMAASARRLISL